MSFLSKYPIPRNALMMAAGLLVIVCGLLASFDLLVAEKKAAALYSVGIQELRLQGDLQYYTQEGRRNFLYALSTDDPNEQLPWVNQARQADRKIQSLIQSSLSLDLDAPTRQGVITLEQDWKYYSKVRDDIIALILEGQPKEAVALDSTIGALAFKVVSDSIWTLKGSMDSYASRQSADVRNAFFRAGLTLALSLVGILFFISALASSNRKKQQALESLKEAHDELTRSHQVDSERNLVLELVGRNEPLDVILDLVAQSTQRREPRAMCAISVRKGDHLMQCAAPGLPAEFREAIQVIALGKNATCCSAAATSGKLSVVENIEASPLWEHYRDVAKRNGIQACFSTPLFSVTQEIIGTFALYWSEPHPLTEQIRFVMESAGRLAAVAIEHRQLYDRLAFQAQHDSLTELPNRLLLQDRLKHALELAKRRKEKVGVFWLDLDRFKHVNDTLGHRVGDMLLRQVAQRLLGCVRASDTIARIGGDEFILVAAGLHDNKDAHSVATKILEAMREPFLVMEHLISVSGSVGVSLYPDHGQEASALIRNADAAMYVAKQDGKNTFHCFAPEVAAAADRRLEIEKCLRLAIQNSELELYYQPLVNADNRWEAMEALLRWQSSELGIISPTEFIPVAEDCGLIAALGQWVLWRACRQAVEWQNLGLPPLRIAVNISSIEFERPDFVNQLRVILQETGINPRLLELEMTERVVMKAVTDSLARFEEIQKLGVKISIDDFGTGYSSLSYLHYLTADSIKIDRSFIVDLHADSKNTHSVVLAIIQMAHSMNMKVIAEGVETEAQVLALRRAGCNLLQGYLLAPPMPATAVEKQINSINTCINTC